MPIHKNPDGTFQWGKSGKKYKSKKDAIKQMKAIFANGYTQGQTKTASSGSMYTIKPGDTFQGLDKRYKLPLGSMQKANPGISPLKLRPGRRLRVPRVPYKAAIKSKSSLTAPAQLAGNKDMYVRLDRHGRPTHELPMSIALAQVKSCLQESSGCDPAYTKGDYIKIKDKQGKTIRYPRARGYTQIVQDLNKGKPAGTAGVITDVNRLYKTNYNLRDRQHASRQFAIQHRWLNAQANSFKRKHGRFPTQTQLLSMWNGGPGGYNKSTAKEYAARALKKYEDPAFAKKRAHTFKTVLNALIKQNIGVLPKPKTPPTNKQIYR